MESSPSFGSCMHVGRIGHNLRARACFATKLRTSNVRMTVNVAANFCDAKLMSTRCRRDGIDAKRRVLRRRGSRKSFLKLYFCRNVRAPVFPGRVLFFIYFI